MAEWKNWAETVQYTQLEKKFAPENLEELRACVLEARKNSWKLRVVGDGHSWSNLGLPGEAGGAVICMERMPKIFNIIESPRNGEAIVEVGGGLTIEEMNKRLFAANLALFNMGDANPQLVMGAISTETHGSGVRHPGSADSVGSLSETVESMTIVRSNGEVHTLSDENLGDTPAALPAGRLSLGKLGAIYCARLRVRTSYFLDHTQKLVTFNEKSEGPYIENLLKDKSVRHFEYWHYPHTDKAERIERRITTGEMNEIDPLKLTDEWFIKASSSYFANRGARDPEGIPAYINDVMKRYPNTFEIPLRRGPWHKILVGKSNVWRRVVKTYTMEYQFPYSQLWPVFNEYLESIERAKVDKKVYAAPPNQIRFSQKSERSYLTNLIHEPTVSFSVSFFRTHRGAHTWMPDLEQRFLKYGARPHLGKMYYQQPTFDPAQKKKFDQVRQELDASGMFAFEQQPYVPDPKGA